MFRTPHPPRGFVVLTGIVALWADAGVAAAVGPVAAMPSYVVRGWRTDDGLPQNAVTAVLQTGDGYIWVGTYSGLARFDGMRFTVFNGGNTPALRSGRVTSLLQDSTGTLWIGSETGELTTYSPDGQFQAMDMGHSWGRRKIIAMVADQDDLIWLADGDGTMMRLKDGLRLESQPGSAAHLASVAGDRQGHIWVIHNGVASALEQGHLNPKFDEDFSRAYVQGICPSRQGGILLASQGTLSRISGTASNAIGAAPWGFSPLTAMIETQEGWLAAGTQAQGIFIGAPNGQFLNLCRTNQLPSDWISSLCEDREGNLWIGTGGSGLFMIHQANMLALNPSDQWQERPVLCVTSGKNGALWVGTEGAGLYRLQDGQWSHYGVEAGIANLFVWSVCEDAASHLWIGTWDGGLLGRTGDRFDPVPAGAATTRVTALFCDGADQLWAGTGVGLLHRQDEKMAWLTPCGTTPLSDVRCVVDDGQGTLWFGMLGGGLGCLEKTRLRLFHKQDGLSSDFVQTLRPDKDGSLWIGTFGGGLNRLKHGRFSAIGTAQGLADDIVCWMEDDDLGNYWISSHAGIMRVAKRELDLCADGKQSSVHCLCFGKGDGLPTLEFSGGLQPAGCKTPDGRLWFASNKGLVMVNPRDLKLNALAPPVVIEAVAIDGHAKPEFVQNALGRPLRIAPGRHRLEFLYTGLSLAAPEKVRFRYRLEGLDNEWTEAGAKRSASFEYVPPGQYVFHVLACNDAGVWNEKGAAVGFVLLPYFWQTWWFGTSVAALGMGVVGAGVWQGTRRRMRRKMEALERQKAVEHERSRIARDIHDELGSHLTRITMLSEPARHEPDASHPGITDVRQIYDIARALTRTMDEIVWAVNPHHDTPEGLVNYLEQFALEFLGAAGIRCRLDLPMELPAWPLTAETRHNLFLALKEALHNAVKHAGATEVRIALTVDTRTLTLSVEDNGRGFDPAASNSTGNGLENMRRRLEQIRGGCEIVSEPGHGVKIVFVVPIREATAGAPPDYRAN
jgi:signal transduction histidine kinase/ligand-binding sensor domain-containing protein